VVSTQNVGLNRRERGNDKALYCPSKLAINRYQITENCESTINVINATLTLIVKIKRIISTLLSWYLFHEREFFATHFQLTNQTDHHALSPHRLNNQAKYRIILG